MEFYACWNEGVSTPQDRAALFDEVVAKIMARDAFVPIKLERLGVDVRRELLRYRDEVIAADTDEKLIYALLKLSCARKDPHVRMQLVENGLQLPGVKVSGAPVRIDLLPTEQAPIKFAVDYGQEGDYRVFVADYVPALVATDGILPHIGDELLAVNGQSFADYLACVEPYSRYATEKGFWWRMAAKISVKTREYPPHFYGSTARYTLQRPSGETYELALPYLSNDNGLSWTGAWKQHGDQRYPGFKQVLKTSTYHLYRHEQDKPVLILDWNKFDGRVMENTDRLLGYAAEQELLDHAVIFDATRSGGGSLGAYVVRHLSGKPFKTTFGNLRLSDVVEPFIEQMRQRKAAGLPMVAEDDGTWLLDWLETDVRQALAQGHEYSNDVPFKSSHLPQDSDGVMQPAAVHFRGPLVCLLSPHGGSHLDQFAAMLADNDLAHIIGMPAGGYSNTWEWDETLYFPQSKQPVVRFMYSMGHTIRPNGELLEGNPADVHDYIPLTRDNYLTYQELLLERALNHLGI